MLEVFAISLPLLSCFVIRGLALRQSLISPQPTTVDFVPGSILKRRLNGGLGYLFWHMGVYIGSNRVVHFNGETKKNGDAKIVCEDLAVFAGGFDVFLHATPSDGSAVCETANRLLLQEENGYDGKYSFLFNNCEDFAVACFDSQPKEGELCLLAKHQ
jgi:hypothetical protein